MRTRTMTLWLAGVFGAITCSVLQASNLTPANIGAPFGVQPFAGLMVTSGTTEPFFSDLSNLPFPGPAIIDIFANLTAFDASGNQLTLFQVTGVTVTQGTSLFSPALSNFVVTSPVTYTSTLNPLEQVTVTPAGRNLAFFFNSDPLFQYSYVLNVSGIPTGGFLLYDDVEGAFVPEPGSRLMIVLALGTAVTVLRRKHPNKFLTDRVQ